MYIKKYLRLKVKIREEKKIYYFFYFTFNVGTGRRALFVYVSVFLFKPIFDVYNPITTMMRIETHFLFPFKKPTQNVAYLRFRFGICHQNCLKIFHLKT